MGLGNRGLEVREGKKVLCNCKKGIEKAIEKGEGGFRELLDF